LSAIAALLSQSFSPRETGGSSRLAALFFFLLAVAGALAVSFEPQFARWAGALLVAFIGVGAVFLLVAAWPRPSVDIEEARRAAAAAASSNVAWAVTGRDGSVLDCNVAYRFLAGAGDGEPPAPPQLAFPGQGPATALYRLARAANEGRAREEDFETESGQKLTAAVRALSRGESAWWFSPRLPEAAPPKGATEKKNPSALIRFADFFRNAPMGVAVVGQDGTLVEANGVFAAFFASQPQMASASHMAGTKLDAVVGEAHRAATLDLAARAARGELTRSHVDLRIESGVQGAMRTAQLFASPFMPGPEGEPRAILYIVDTTEQNALENQFAQAQKMQAIGQLAGGVAHDFNNLLQAIMGNCDLLLVRHPAGDPSFSEINEVRQNSVRAAGLVRQLLAFSRQQTLQPKVLALSDMLTELSLLLRRLVGEKIALRVENRPDLWPVRADEGQLSNAVMNLVVNARDAMPPEGGAVTIRTANLTFSVPQPIGTGHMPAGDYVLIEVIDTGSGIAKENLNKIFEPFFTTKAVGQGTGLGLSTVWGVVKQTGGFITVDSEIGKGTIFRVYLPRYVADAAAPAEAPAEEPERSSVARDVTGQETVLLVEDEDAVRSFAARALRMRGYTVLDASSGEAGLEVVRNHEGAIDLLITDVVMPNMDGPTLVRAARQLRPDMRIIFMSGYAEDAFRRNEEKAEDLHFLPKPFGLKQLVAKVREVLSGEPPAQTSTTLNDTGT
jgi:two-component system cell cycle sensor histidine kinase/response regulator CckA